MFRNYLNIAFRNLKKNKLISSINIAGLTIGITFFLLLFSYVWDEATYDRFHEKSDKIYTLMDNVNGSSMNSINANTAKNIGGQFPEIIRYVRVLDEPISIEFNKGVNRETVFFTEPSFFEVFTFPLKYGNAGQALNQPYNVVISEEIAQKYFGDNQPLGKSLMLSLGNEKTEFHVTGVLKKIPGNSSIRPAFLVPFKNIYKVNTDFKETDDFQGPIQPVTFFEINKNISIPHLENKITAFARSISTEDSEFKNKRSYLLSKFTDSHYEKVFYPSSVLAPICNPVYSYILAALALGILLLACFNYMNLSIGNFTSRFKEIGARKVVGAEKKEIVKQFLTEAGCITFIAFMFSIILTQLLLPTFNELSGKLLNLDYLLTWKSMSIILILIIGTTLATGCYPALVLSKINAVDIFKGRTQFGGKKKLARIFIVFQFCLAILLITGTLLIKKQLNFIQSKDLGFDPKNLVIIKTFGGPHSEVDANKVVRLFKESLAGYPQIESVSGVGSGSAGALADDGLRYMTYIKDGAEVDLLELRGDLDYITTLKATVIKGRSLSEKFPSDMQNTAVVNESFLKAFKIKDPIGKTLSEIALLKHHGDKGYYQFYPKIIGVVKDFHVSSFYKEIKPVAIVYGDGWDFRNIAVRITSGNIKQAIPMLEQTWKKTGLVHPFTFRFLEDILSEVYKTEKQWNEIFGYTSFFAIVIAGMGLLGLSALSIARRTKEVGIRKVLGAELKNIYFLLSREFVLLVAISCVIAWPLAYYLGGKWLDNFAYHTSIGFDVLCYSLGIAMLVAMAAVSYYTLKAAFVNPVESLKSE